MKKKKKFNFKNMLKLENLINLFKLINISTYIVC